MWHHKLNQLYQHKLNRWDFIKTGLLLTALGVCFIYDRSFFFYPPSLAPAWNNIFFDIAGLVCGILLMIIGSAGHCNEWLVKLTLGVSVAFLTVLVIAECFHVFGAGYFRFHPAIVFEIYAIVNLMQLAYEYNPEDL